MDERIEEIRRGRALAGHRQKHLAGSDRAALAVESGIVEILEGQHEQRRTKAVTMLDKIRKTIGETAAGPIERDGAGMIAILDRQRVAARERRHEQTLRFLEARHA